MTPSCRARDMPRTKHKSSDRQEVESLVRDYRTSGEIALRDQLISQHLYLVQTVARRFAGLGESYDDLLQEGTMGLINAVDLYDPDRGVQFATYATHLVEGQIRHYLRDRGKLIKQPAWVQELTTKIMKATESLTQELDREPTMAETAARVGVAPDTIRKMLEARERSKVASLDAGGADDEEFGPAVDPEKLRTQHANGALLPVEDRIFLRESMSRLKALEQKVVYHFYYLDLNQSEIARKLGISVNYASYLLRGALGKLRKNFEAQQAAAEAMATDQAPATRPASTAVTYSLSARSSPTDPATKLATEAYFRERLAQEVERAGRYPQQFSVLVVAPDAALNDDARLALAKLLRSNVRSIDLVACLPEAQFGLLLPHTGREATVLADRIVRTVSSRLQGGEDTCTVSIGVAIFPGDGRSVEGLLSAAQESVSEARLQGGDRYLRLQSLSKS